METQEHWYKRRAVEQLAQHVPFERDVACKAEQIEMLRELVIHYGRDMDPDLFGFEARNELIRLGLWSRIGQRKRGEQRGLLRGRLGKPSHARQKHRSHERRQ